MTSQKNGPGRPRSEKADTAILDAAMEMLVDVGYAGLTLDKVAASARVSKSTIYRRWESKQHLVIAALDSTPRLSCDDQGDLVLELQELLKQFLQIVKNTPLGGVLPTLMGERARDPELSGALDPMIKARRKPIKDAIKRAVDRGEIDSDLNLELAVDMVMGPIIMRIMFGGSNITPRSLKPFIMMTLRGLGMNAV